MTPKEVEELLVKTIEDRRVSRAERMALKKVLHEEQPDENWLAAVRARAFNLATEALRDPRDRQVIEWLLQVVKTIQPDTAKQPMARAVFSPGTACVERITQLFDSARNKVDVCVFTITDDRISKAILAAHRRGVRIRLITDNDKAMDTGSDVDHLADAGIPVVVDRTEHHMHHKFAIFDARVLVTGSYNWTRSAASYNQENIVVVEDQRLVSAFSGEFTNLWRDLEH